MFLADFIALIFQLTPSALQDNKHVSRWLDKDGFSSVLLEVVIVPITTPSGTQNNKPQTRSFSIHYMNFTWDKTLQVKPSVCFGQCSCEDFCTTQSRTRLSKSTRAIDGRRFLGAKSGILSYHPFFRRTFSEKKVPLNLHKLAPQTKVPKSTGHV